MDKRKRTERTQENIQVQRDYEIEKTQANCCTERDVNGTITKKNF